MSKIDEIKQALAAGTPGPWRLETVDDEGDLLGVWADVQGEPGVSASVCEFDSEIFVSDADKNLIANAPEYIAYLLEQVEQQPELWDCPSCGFTFDAGHEDIDPVTGEGNGNHTCPQCETVEVEQERDRLRKELEETQRANDVMAKYLNELLHNTSNMVTALQVVNVLREAIGREEFDPVGQEGEGNQRTIEVTLINEGYKEHKLTFDNED